MTANLFKVVLTRTKTLKNIEKIRVIREIRVPKKVISNSGYLTKGEL